MISSAGIPSPSQGVWYLGPFPLRAYALAILAGIVLAYWILQRRYRARGGPTEALPDIAMWAVVLGIIGGRLYHVISSPAAYFGPNGTWYKAFYIWEGGLGIWGAIALGALGMWIGARRQGLALPPLADALAPGLLVAQAVGRLGNYFNQELFGSPTTLPWGLQVSDAVAARAGYPAGTLFHPTFLYELCWNLLGALVLVWLDRRFRMGHGRVFWLYVIWYTAGRGWIEMLRVDEANHVLGLRLNVWTSILVFVLGIVGYLVTTMRYPGRESDVYLPGRAPAQVSASSHLPSDPGGASGETAASGSGARQQGAREDLDSVTDGEPPGQRGVSEP